jgi:hypothetical protein
VGPGCPHVRDGGRLPALFRRPAHSDLREDRLGQGSSRSTLSLRITATQSVCRFNILINLIFSVVRQLVKKKDLRPPLAVFMLLIFFPHIETKQSKGMAFFV